jgi:hypothetical protein
MRRLTLEDFITRSNLKHDNKFDYSKSDYKNAHIHTTVICKEHGEFLVEPFLHMNGAGCQKCLGRNKTTAEYIAEVAVKHNNKYDYSKVDYTGCFSKIEIICPVHGSFIQPADYHRNGNGCPKCNGKNVSFEEFLEIANNNHNNFYDYSLAEPMYKNLSSKIDIICPVHGVFTQTAANARGQRCYKCGVVSQVDSRTKTLETFILEAKQCYGDIYDYSLVDYTGSFDLVKIICKEHGIFKQAPSSHINGRGCIKCNRKAKQIANQKRFITESTKMHGDIYDYSLVDFTDNTGKIKIICKKHGVFEQNYHSRITSGCPACNRRISAGEIQWLNSLGIVERQKKLKINKSTRFVDGFDPNTNTIYLYHGDFWHGNPKTFNSIEINRKTNTTFGELYNKTMIFEQELKDMGYNVITIWEKDWNEQNRQSC